MKHIFIINPSTGQKTLDEYLNQIASVCREEKRKDKNNSYELKYTLRPNDAMEIARQYSNNENIRIYCVGGDGTLNEIINGIANTNTVIGLIPNGTGNDFFRSLSSSKEDIVRRTIHGDIQEVNTGMVNDRHFINIASVGYDAQTIHNSLKLKNNRLIPSKLLYLASVLYTITNFQASFLDINFQDKNNEKIKLEQYITLLAVCNGKYYGNGIPVAPNANYQDDLFDLCIADDLKKAQILALLPVLMKGKQENLSIFHTYNTNHITIDDNHCTNPLYCQFDGEIMQAHHYDFKMNCDKVKIIKPKENH